MSKLEELVHHETEILGGGVVIVLDTGSLIDAESVAMLQALHSRSIGGLNMALPPCGVAILSSSMGRGSRH